MKTSYKLDKSFGPIGSSAGVALFIAGVAIVFVSLFGLILIVAGAILGFTSTCTIIDFDTKRIKFSEKWFGIIPIGKWIQVEPRMKIGIKNSKMIWSAYSRGNRSIDVEEKDFRLILLDDENREIMPVLKAETLDSVIAKMEIICIKLDINPLE
jgi:hypothetical protein